jgi:hypothetical protein
MANVETGTEQTSGSDSAQTEEENDFDAERDQHTDGHEPHHATQRLHTHDDSRQKKAVDQAGHERDRDRQDDSEYLHAEQSGRINTSRKPSAPLPGKCDEEQFDSETRFEKPASSYQPEASFGAVRFAWRSEASDPSPNRRRLLQIGVRCDSGEDTRARFVIVMKGLRISPLW